MKSRLTYNPDSLIMIRPASFQYNNETNATNFFQKEGNQSNEEVQSLALHEFNKMADLLLSHEIDVHVFEDTPVPSKPDAIFPNNWISTHPDGTVVLYPMMAENRRHERRTDIIEHVSKYYDVKEIVDLSAAEAQGHYLEGTGSIVFDHAHKIMYACGSPRTNEDLLQKVAQQLQYKCIRFKALDEQNQAIYHTNVVLSIGSEFAVICLDAISDENDQEILLTSFERTGRKVIAISFAQMRSFAGNIYEVQSRANEPVVLISDSAFNSLLPGQINAISQFADMLPIKIETIEKYGGGSVRCMVAGIYLPRRN